MYNRILFYKKKEKKGEIGGENITPSGRKGSDDRKKYMNNGFKLIDMRCKTSLQNCKNDRPVVFLFAK